MPAAKLMVTQSEISGLDKSPFEGVKRCDRCANGTAAASRFQAPFEGMVLVEIRIKWKNHRPFKVCLDCLVLMLEEPDQIWKRMKG
jgi:hypothetical protein